MAQSSSSASVEEESQAAQILAQLLETQQTDGDQLQALQDSERSEDCYKRNTMPATRYHTNGLGHTQTDSQFSGEGPETCQIQVEEEEGSSQKENMNSSLTNESSGSIPGLTWSKRATKGTEETVERNTSAATKGHTSKFNSRSSPRRGRGNKSSPKHSLSQDSFIGPASNPAEAYIATSRHFNIPLSQLAESSEETQQNMYRYQSGPQYNPKPPNLGNVLVDDTPPNSGGEESQSQEERVKPQSVDHNAPPRQHFEDLDVDVDAEPDPQSQSRQPSSQGSSQGASQMKFWEDQANGKNWEPTQSTQPEQSQSDPVSEWDTIMEQLREMKVRVAPYYTNMNAIRRPAYISQLRHLLITASSAQNSGQSSNQSTSVAKASVTAIHGGDTDDWEETQVNTQLLNDSSPPSPLEDESHLVPGLLSTRPPPPCPKPPPPQLFDSEPTQLVTEQPVDHSCLRRQLPASRSTKGSVQTPCERRRPTVSIDPDAMDIVPDSEPPVASPQRTFTETTPSVRSKDLPSKKEDHSMDIVPDSEEPRAPSLEPLTEEEGEDDDSDDVPLNALVKGSRKVKGLTSAEAMPPPPTTTRQGKGKATPAGKGKGKAKAAPPKPARTASPAVATSRRSNRRTRATEDEVVPSSVPEETPKPKRPKRGASRATPGSSRKKRRTETDDEVIKTEPDATDDGATTEATADEDTVPSTLKRKLQRSTVEPVASSSKRLGTTPRRRIKSSEYRVFALSKSDGHYFSGTLVHCDSNTGNYVVEFSDKSSASLTLEHIRRCELRIGDEVLWEEEMIGWKVTAWQGEAEETIVSLELEGAEVPRYISDIRIAMCTIETHWNDRRFDPDSPVLAALPRRNSGTCPRPSTAPTPAKSLGRCKRPQQYLKGFGIITTLPNEGDIGHISKVGALLIGSWDAAIKFPITRVDSMWHGWYMKRSDVVWILPNTSRIFLVTNAPYTTPKYLLAAALGIPCVSLTWVTDMRRERTIRDWSQYLLPQGFSEILKLRTSQMVDMDWGNSPEHTKRIMDNPASAKLFAGCSILCVTEETPSAQLDTSATGPKSLAMIILAMGADYVEIVDCVADRSKTAFDYVIYLKRSQFEVPDVDIQVDGEALWDGRAVKVRSWNWTKECLIANRLLPVRSSSARL